jgi:Ser/Thr protein kinase RdoA (MazF antagonist)
LGDHLAHRYGIRPVRTTTLDVGVVRIDHDAGAWIARVFPACRPAAAVERDAAVLRFLDEQRVPAERLATDEPVSVLGGQPVLVTTLLPGRGCRDDGHPGTAYHLGDVVGRLHALPSDGPPWGMAGGWHHLSPAGGGRRMDVEVLAGILADERARRSEDDRAGFTAIVDAVASVDTGEGLPEALIHPDPCGANAIAGDDGLPVLIDWTGAGRGPRAASLANLLISAATLECVDAAVAGYSQHVILDDDELDRLPPLLEAFRTILDAWCLLFIPGTSIGEVGASRAQTHQRANAIAERARAAFAAGPADPARWGVPPDERQADGAQQALFDA